LVPRIEEVQVEKEKKTQDLKKFMDELRESGIKFPADYNDRVDGALNDSNLSLNTSKIITTEAEKLSKSNV